MRLTILLLALALSCATRPILLPTGASITPLGAKIDIAHPIATALSPDGATLLVLTSGYKSPADPTEHIHVLDAMTLEARQNIDVTNAFQGIAWDPDGQRFHASGGADDRLLSFARGPAGFAPAGEIKLGHQQGIGLQIKPMAAGLATDGRRQVVANYENDSISIIEGTNVIEVPLCGFPIAAAIAGNKVYVSCQRDGELAIVDLDSAKATNRIRVGRQPGRMISNKSLTRLYVANGGSDSVSVVDPATDKVLEEIPTAAPPARLAALRGLKGANPNALALSADEQTLYVTNGGTNSLAVIDLSRSSVRALIPTGWYPHAVTIAGGRLIIANGKNVAGPNPGGCRNHLQPAPCLPSGQYVLQLIKGGLSALSIPDLQEEQRLTERVAINNHFDARPDDQLFEHLRSRIHHVIYIVKENRTYDQVLGDLGRGNGDPKLTLFPEAISPNHHALARDFVTLDAFFDSGQVSGDGWNWSTAGRTSDVTEKSVPVQYGNRGLSYDYEGDNRNLNTALTGETDVAAPGDYLWDAALAKGLTVRNYGFFADDTIYEKKHPDYLPTSRAAFAEKKLQFVPTKKALSPISDPYFRSFDQTFADYWNYKEWEREFDQYEKDGNLPALELVRFAHDHFGSFAEAEDGVNTPETQMADNDYALGLLIEKIARSRYASDTVIFVIEDDAQNGPDHVDAQRSIALIAGAHVKQGAVISRAYNTVSLLKTIESLLDLSPLGLTDGFAEPMADVFERTAKPWSYVAKIPNVLRTTKLPLPPGPTAQPRHDARWWADETAGQDFSHADAADAEVIQRALWRGLR